MDVETPSELVRFREELRARIAPVINRAVWEQVWHFVKLIPLFLAPMALGFACLSVESTVLRTVGTIAAATLMMISMFVIAYRMVLTERATAEKHHLVCAKCEIDLNNCNTSKASEAAKRFPGWSPMDRVPLRCWNCGAFVEEYITPELAALIGMAGVETDVQAVEQ